MKNKNIVKEIKSYSAIFLFFILIFTYCSNNMTFAASYCSDYGVDESINKFQRCRENSIKEDINNASNYLDIDGNLPITCGDVDVPFNPYKEDGDDYYYDSKNTACLAGALTINISLSVTSIAAGLACGGVQVIDKAIKDGHGWRAAYEIVDQIINGAAGIAEGAVIGTVADPLITIPAQAGGTAAQLILLGISTTNWACVGIAGGIATGILVAYYAYIGTQQLLEKEYINDIKTCGYDWNTYAYTQYDMEAPSIEWYPQYGSFSNSYSYKLDKIITGEYNCDEFITFSGNDKKSYSKNSNATACSNQASSCKAALRECMANQTNDVNPNLSLCIKSYDSTCTESCAKYYAICEPMLSTLDGDGYCVNPSDDDEFCKDIFSYSKNIKNRYYREALYRGKEYKISTTYYGEEDACIDPRTNEQKGYSGLEQRYYFKGKEAAQYACGRFQYKGGGCILADGSFSNNEIECRQAFEDAKTCCENRRALGICIYDSENNDRNNNTMCLRSGSSDSDPETCTLDVGTIKPKFKAYQSQYNSIDICIRSDNFCPYDFNLSGGTELQQLYCDGEYLDYGCSDYYKIWRKGAINYPTQSYGQIKNFCFYRAHCTEMGESDYAFPEMTSSKYLPQACSDFIGDSRNLPEPLSESENSSKDNVNLKMFRGFTAPMAQCIRETIYNMFHNIAGRSICMDGSTPNDDGYCSTDTEKSLTDFKEGKAITEENFPEQYDRYNKYSSYNDYITSTYAMIIGEQLEESENIFYNIQKNVQLLIKLAAAIAIIVIGITFLMKGDLDI